MPPGPEAPPTRNGYAVTALILGVAVLLFNGTSPLGSLALPLATVGMVFAAMALWAAYTGRRGRVTLAWVAAGVTVAAFVLSLVVVYAPAPVREGDVVQVGPSPPVKATATTAATTVATARPATATVLASTRSGGGGEPADAGDGEGAGASLVP